MKSNQSLAFIDCARGVYVAETIEVNRHGITTVYARLSIESSGGETTSSDWISLGMSHAAALARLAQRVGGTLYTISVAP